MKPPFPPLELASTKIRHVTSISHGFVCMTDLGLNCLVNTNIDLNPGFRWRARLNKPMGLTTDGHNNILVACLYAAGADTDDEGGCIEVLDSNCYYLRTLRPRGLAAPSDLLVDKSSGDLFVADFRNRTVLKYRTVKSFYQAPA